MNHKTYKKIYMFCQNTIIGRLIDKIPDKTYLTILYLFQCGKLINIDHPLTFNEKLQWLKIYGNYEKYWNLVDKAEVKLIVETLIGKKYIIPTYAIVNEFVELDIEALPQQFVLKCTHDSGSTIVCMDKRKFDFSAAQRKLNKLLQINYYKYLRETQYKNVRPRIIAEKFVGINNIRPYEYKFFCFNGVPKIVMVVKDRDTLAKSNFYDMNFQLLPLQIENPNFYEHIEYPSNFTEMKNIATKLSQGYKHIRVDLYNINGKIYFSEYTFQHWGGFSHISPPEWNDLMGKWITL